MTDYSNATASEIAKSVRAGNVTARSIVEVVLVSLETEGKALNAVSAILTDRALARADHIDAMIAAGKDPGPLAGVPFAVKDLFDVCGQPTLAGSKIQADAPPAKQDATAISFLESSGAILCATQRMDEFAYGFTTENAHYGPTRNPHDRDRIAGGSSGGSAATVAGGLLPFSIGTDTNGSIRVPASLCGIYGLKPTYGRVSRAGAFLFVGSIDCIGPFARSVDDLRLVFESMQGEDARDPVLDSQPPASISWESDPSLDGLRVRRLGGYFSQTQEPEARAAVDTVCHSLHCDQEAVFPEPSAARSAAFVVSACEGGRLHANRLRERADDFDPAVRNRLVAGACAPSSWYLQAQAVRKKLQPEVLALFDDADVLIAPATPLSAPLIGQTEMTIDGTVMATRPNLGMFTQSISFFGLPVLTVPVLSEQGMPVGVQLIGKPFGEAALFQAARYLEASSSLYRPIIPITK